MRHAWALVLLVSCAASAESNGGPASSGGASGASTSSGASSGATTSSGGSSSSGGSGSSGSGASSSGGTSSGASSGGSGSSGSGSSGSSGGGGGTPCTPPAPGDGIVFLSPSGDDSQPGTSPMQAIKTLDHAAQIVRGMSPSQTADIHVYLAPGVYPLAQTFALTAQDSGGQGHDVVYSAYPSCSQAVVISGGVPVTGWAQSDPTRNRWLAPAPAALTNTRQLYVNGVRALRARGNPTSIAGWKNPGDIEYVFTGGNTIFNTQTSHGAGAWTEPRCPVQSVQGSTVTMMEPCWTNTTQRNMYPNHVGPSSSTTPQYIENALELLDSPGEWYLDRTAKTISYIPRPGEDLTTADVEAPVLETLVSIAGTDGAPAHNIVFQGLQFSYATWLGASGPDGFSEIQANHILTGTGANNTQGLCMLAPNGTCPFASWPMIPANVTVRFAQSIRFLGDAFVHLGAAGLALGVGTQGATVQGSVFTDISGNGVEIGATDDTQPSATQLVSGNQVLDNHLYGLPREFHGGVAILDGYTQRTTIAHNEIDHTAYSAISMGWGGWLDKIMQPAIPNPSKNNTVANNLIHDHMLLLADGGAIYTQGLTGSSLADGEKVTGNVIRDQFGSGHGIYTDNGCTYETITGNVIFHTNFDDWGGTHVDYQPGASGNDPTDIEGNFWEQGDPDGSASNVTEKGNQIVASLADVPASVLQAAGLEPAYQGILSWTFGDPSAPEPPQRVAVAPGNGFALVTWNPPVFEGGAPVLTYTVTSSGGDKATIAAADFLTAGYAKVSGLTNGTAYTFTVTADNANGSSSPSLPSPSVTPAATGSAPGAPASVSAFGGKGVASVHFTSPASDGGSPVTSFTITASPGGASTTVAGRIAMSLGPKHSTFGVVGGLAPGKYTFRVTANNAAGSGPAATATATVQ